MFTPTMFSRRRMLFQHVLLYFITLVVDTTLSTYYYIIYYTVTLYDTVLSCRFMSSFIIVVEVGCGFSAHLSPGALSEKAPAGPQNPALMSRDAHDTIWRDMITTTITTTTTIDNNDDDDDDDDDNTFISTMIAMIMTMIVIMIMMTITSWIEHVMRA